VGDDISIRERIERQVHRTVTAIDGIGTVRRWDARGATNPANLDAFVYSGEEAVADDAEGNLGLTVKYLTVNVAVLIMHDENTPPTYTDTDRESTAFLVNRWLAKIEAAVLANPKVRETGGTTDLAYRIAVRKIGEPGADNGVAEAVLEFGVEYSHVWDDPYSGNGIVKLTE
jgi:hypothetical protein